MRMLSSAIAVLAPAVSVAVAGAEFTLRVAPMTAEEAFCAPGRSGAFLYLAKSETMRVEPPALSSRPLYGRLDAGLVFRLDESRGTGKGYNRLLADLNGNGDLSDDYPAEAAGKGRGQRPSSGQATFGPVEMPAKTGASGSSRAFYARVTIYDPQQLAEGTAHSSSIVGYLTVKPASYLVADVVVNGVAQKLGFWDGNGNLRVGDRMVFNNACMVKGREWEWESADFLLRDWDGSGKFERRPAREELGLLGSLVYFGGQPFVWRIDEERLTAVFAPYDGPLATVAPTSTHQLESLTLLRKVGGESWECITPELVMGKAVVPAGSYQLYKCVLSATGIRGAKVLCQGFKAGPGREVVVGPNETGQLPCGTPFTAKVRTVKVQRNMAQVFGLGTASHNLVIQAELIGAGAEAYPAFFKRAEYPKRMPVKCRFEIKNRFGLWSQAGTLRQDVDGFFTGQCPIPSYMLGQAASLTVSFGLDAQGFGDSTKGEAYEVRL